MENYDEIPWGMYRYTLVYTYIFLVLSAEEGLEAMTSQ